MDKKFTPAQEAHLYALMAWNDQYDLASAQEIISTTPYVELDGKTYAETSVVAAIEGIKEAFTNGGTKLDVNSDFTAIKAENNDEAYDKIIKILEKIHDKWVEENAKKYSRGDKKLYQHMPTQLIGLEELSKDLMFLAPFLKEMGIDVGQMELKPYGAFVCNDKMSEAYDRYVENYMKNNNIQTADDLEYHVREIVNGAYKSLKPTTPVAQERLDYMKEHIGLLVELVKDKNLEAFGKLPYDTENE